MRWLALALLFSVGGCRETPPPPPPPAPTPSRTAVTVPPVAPPSDSATAPEPRSEAVLKLRPLRSLVAEGEPIRLLLHWHGEDGWLDRAGPPGANELDWSGATLTVTSSDASWDITVPATGLPAHELADVATSELSIARDGQVGLVAPLPPGRDPMTAALDLGRIDGAFAATGTYSIGVQITVSLGGEKKTFVARDPAVVERRKGVLRVDELERRARAAVEAHLKKGGRADAIATLSPATLIVDTSEAHDRLVRFRTQTDQKWNILFLEAVVSPTGQVKEVREQERFTCVAEGTPIATPEGPRPIETLRVGDAVIGYDVARRRRTVTHVRAISEPRLARTIRLGDLAVTPNHPIYRDGTWIEAGSVEVGAGVGLAGPRPLAAPRPGRWEPVIDLVVEAPHTYFAAGILVHNKKVALPAWRFDPWFVLWEPVEGEYQLIPSSPE